MGRWHGTLEANLALKRQAIQISSFQGEAKLPLPVDTHPLTSGPRTGEIPPMKVLRTTELLVVNVIKNDYSFDQCWIALMA
jgi:hypothetical protein